MLKARFKQQMEEAKKNFLSLIHGKTGDKAVEAVLEHFLDENKRHDFYKFFKEISTIYEILSPDAFLRPYVDDYETLARMYRILKEAYEGGLPIDKEFMRKTARLVQEQTHSDKIKATLDIYEIDEETLRKIEESKASGTEKIFNLIVSIENTIRDRLDREPYLISIGERAEAITRLFKERQKNTEETLRELKKLIEEINEARKEQAERNMPVEAFSIFWMFKKEGVSEPEAKANQMKGILEKYPYWKKSEKHERSVKQELYKILIQSKVENVTEMAKRIIRVIKGETK